jgi:hypothetical protein
MRSFLPPPSPLAQQRTLMDELSAFMETHEQKVD